MMGASTAVGALRHDPRFERWLNRVAGDNAAQLARLTAHAAGATSSASPKIPGSGGVARR